MLKKLIRYELLSIKTPLRISLILLPSLGVIGFFAAWLMTSVPDLFLMISVGAIFGASMLGLFFAAFLAPCLLIIRYYQSYFTDEGYLTMMLPVSNKQKTFAKLLVASCVSLGTGLIAILSLMLVITGFNLGVGGRFWLTVLFAGVDPLLLTAYLIEIFLSLIATAISQIIIFYVSITLGAVVFSKNKLLGAVIFYFVVNAVISLATTLLNYLVIGLAFTAAEGGVHVLLIGTFLIYAGIAVGGYFYNLYLLNHKLNLE